MISFKGAHVPQDILLTGVRWDIIYPWNYRHEEELMEERGMPVDHATLQRWDVQYRPQLEEVFHRRKRSVWISWRMGETSFTVKGEWRYRYRAVETHSETSDFLLTEQRDAHAAKRFLTKAIHRHGVPEKSTIEGIAANDTTIRSSNAAHGTTIAMRKKKALNNIVAQDHRGVQRVTGPMKGGKSFEAAPSTLMGIALMPMFRKGQLENGGEQGLTAAEQCYALASSSANQPGVTSLRSTTHQYLRHNSHAPWKPHHP